MTFVVGDIHGEISKLKKLIENINLLDESNKLVFIGDYVNKGENSKEVLEYLLLLKRKKPSIIFLMGNHEYYYLQYIKHKRCEKEILKYGLETTFVDFKMDLDNIGEKFYEPYKEIFDNLKSYYETDKYFVSHAGIDLSYMEQDFTTLSEEKFFLFSRYDFFNYQDKIHGKIAVFGHTGFNYPYYDGYKIGIDTGAVYSSESRLTAFCLEEEYFINNENEKTYLNELKLDRTPWINRVEPYRTEKI
jgi:serine/threonine protein phosphatase 1